VSMPRNKPVDAAPADEEDPRLCDRQVWASLNEREGGTLDDSPPDGPERDTCDAIDGSGHQPRR